MIKYAKFYKGVFIMKNYELIIEKHQPPCSGRPTLHEIREIETEDPVSYVKAHTKNARLEIDAGDGGATMIVAEEGDYRTKFVFSEI
jgi:hypothetical protein